MQARFYAFSKRRNSTKIPASDEGVDRDIVLKKPTSLINPVIQTQTVNDEVNYVYIPEFARYYFIDDTIKLNNGITEFRLSVDVLGSMRAEILPKAAYVTRAYSQTDSSLSDTFYPTLAGTQQKKESTHFIPIEYTYGGYVISAIGIAPSATYASTGACQFYLVSGDQMTDIIKFTFDQQNYQDSLTDGVVKTFFNPSQYLVSCYYCPFLQVDSPTGIPNYGPFRYGWWQDSGNYRIVSGDSIADRHVYTVNIPRPVNSDPDNYLNYAPFAAYRIYIPFYGMFDLDSELLKGADVIAVKQTIDTATGNGMISVELGNDEHNESIKTLFTAEASVSVPIPLAQSSMPLNYDTAAAGLLKNVVGRTATTAFDQALADISSMYLDVNRQVSTKGTIGSFVQQDFIRDIIVICDYKTQAEKNHALFGDPLCKAVRLSDMNGFVRCLSFNMQSNNYLQTECDQVNQYLNGGAYIE